MALTLNQLREQYPELTGTSDEVLVNFLHQNYYSDIPLNEFTKAVGFNPEGEASDLRSYALIPALKGTADIGGAVGYGLEASGIAPEYGRDLQESAQDVNARLTARQSQEARDDSAKTLIDENGNYGGYNLGTLSQQLFQSAPGMLAMGAPGGLLARGATAGAKALGAGKAASTIGSGLGFGAAEGIYSGATNAAQFQEEYRNTPFDKLVDNPVFIETYHTETDPDASQEQRLEQTRDILARRGGDDVFKKTTATTGGLGVFTGGGMFGMIRDGAKGGILSRVGQGFLKEGILQEAPQSALEQRHSNVAKRDYLDPSQDVNQGVLSSGLEGGLVGGVMGVGGGVFSRDSSEAIADIGKSESVDEAIAAAGNAVSQPIGLPAPNLGIEFDRTTAMPRDTITFSDGSTIDANEYFQQRKAEHGDETRARQETYQALNGKPEKAPFGLPELVFTEDGRSLDKAELIRNFTANGATEQQAQDYIKSIADRPAAEPATDALADYRSLQAGSVRNTQLQDQLKGILSRDRNTAANGSDAERIDAITSQSREPEPADNATQDTGSGIAEGIVRANTIPGIGAQQAIDQQFQDGGYNPLSGAWETPNYAEQNIQPTTQPKRGNDRTPDTGNVGSISGNDNNLPEQQQVPVSSRHGSDDTGPDSLDPILTAKKQAWVKSWLNDHQIKPKSPGYGAKFKEAGEAYEQELNKALAKAPFDVFANHPVNSGVPKGDMLKQAHEALRDEFGITDAAALNQDNESTQEEDQEISSFDTKGKAIKHWNSLSDKAFYRVYQSGDKWHVELTKLGISLKNAGIDLAKPASKSAKLRKESDRLAAEAHSMLNGIAPGQPIHSTRDRNLREKSAEKMRKAAELSRKADEIDDNEKEQSATIGETNGLQEKEQKTTKTVSQETPKASEITADDEEGHNRNVEAVGGASQSPLATKEEYHYKEADSAYSHSSRYGAQAARDSYVNSINKQYERLSKDLNDEQKQYLDDSFIQLKRDYLEKEKPVLSARSGIVSAHIAGGSKFKRSLATRGQGALDRATENHNKWFKGAISNIEQGIKDKRDKSQIEADNKKSENKAYNKALGAFAGTVGAMNDPGNEKALFMNSAKRNWASLKSIGDDEAYKAIQQINKALESDSKTVADAIGKRSQLWKEIDQFIAAYEANQNSNDEPVAPDTEIPESDDAPEQMLEPVTADTEEQAESVNPSSPIDAFKLIMQGLNEGAISIDEFKKGFETVVASKEIIEAELSKQTKAQLLDSGYIAYYHKNEKKDFLIHQAYKGMLADFFISDDLLSYGMGKDSYVNAIRNNVESLTQDDLDSYAAKRKKAVEERKQEIAKKIEGVKDPKTLDDFQNYMRVKIQDEKLSFADARMTLTPDQRAKYDELVATKSRQDRSYRKERDTDYVATNRAETDAEIVKTVHTRDNYDLWVVKAADRVEREIYNDWNATAKKLGGWYSSFKGRGATPGFQFKTEESAQAFQQYISKGDKEAVQEQAKARRDAYQDDKTQGTVERLTEMADRLEESANDSMNQDRKVNTNRRAGMAARAEDAARKQIALASTMRNIADAISDGTANFLDRVRQKVQVEFLQGMVGSAHYRQLMDETKGSYGEYEKRKYEAPTQVTADYAEFPSYSAYRSDLANLARQLIETDGTKQLGKDLLKVADDVTDAYLKFAETNIPLVGGFSTKDGDAAKFSSMKQAELSIAASGYNGKAIPFKVPGRRGIIPILSPSEAQIRGIWKGDNDKRITLNRSFGDKLIAALGKANRKQQKISVPWQFERAHSDLARLQKMGIESPAEFRAALREFIDLKEQPAQEDKIKKLERSIVGRANDGLDFFPTPQSVADEMIAAADIQEGMKVLEPSAGMGHIADQIRDAGVDPDVIELSGNRRELLEAKGHNIVAHDFMDYNEGGYDRIIMNPPFSDRRDAAHVQHAYDLLKPGGRLVAIMGEGVFFGSDKKASSFMDWLDSVGGEHEKMPENTFMDKSLPVTTGVNTRMVVIEKPSKQVTEEVPRAKDSVLYSKATKEDLDFASEVISELAEVDEMFRYPISGKTTLEGVMKDVAPKFRYLGEDTRADEKRESGADNRFVFKTDKDREFYVYESGNEIWIDVSRLDTGDRGSAIYHAVGNYAYNADRVFVGDPEGLSNDAVIRRTANMLSLVLRFGSTDFIEPSIEQKRGIPELGIDPLKWQGSDVDKVQSLIHTFLANLENNFPELNNVKYDFNKRDFIRTDNGMPVDWGKVAGERRRRGLGEAARAGQATARRGAFLRSLISSESSERHGILEYVLNRASSLVKNGNLTGLFSNQSKSSKSDTHTKASLTQSMQKVMDKKFGNGWFSRLLATDKFKIIDRDEAAQYDANAVDAQAFYHPESDTSFFIAENIGKDDDLSGLMLHEIGVHQLSLGKNDAEFQAILKQLDNLKDKHPKIKAAYARIPADTKAEHRLEELAAYIAQESPSLPISKRIVAWFKNSLRTIAKHLKGADRLKMMQWANRIDEADVVLMATKALRSAPDELAFYGGDIMKVGVLKSFAGEKAKTADAYQLSAAQQRLDAGEDAETVRKETGWHRGVDGKWRFEIDDSDAKLNTKWIKNKKWYSSSKGTKYIGDLEYVLDHPKLFAAYPELKNVYVNLNIGGEIDSVNGYIDAAVPGVYLINLNADSNESALSALLHEVQHGIQATEGFSRGGSLESQLSSSEIKELSLAKAIIDSPEVHSNIGQDAVNDAMWIIKKINKLAFERYKKLSGEVEARNTQSRQKMTSELRRNTPPSTTQDVSDSDVIVVFNGEKMASEPANSSNDIRYSIGSPQDLFDDLAEIPKPTYKDLLDKFQYSLSKGKSKSVELGLSALTQSQLTQIGAEILPNLKQFGIERNHYDVEESTWHNRADKIAEKWEKLIPGGKKFLNSKAWKHRNKLEQMRLSEVMHEMTVSEIDPRMPEPVPNDKNGVAIKAHKDLKAKYDKLLPDTKKLLDKVDQFHQAVLDKLVDSLTDKITVSEMPEENKERLVNDIKAKFKTQKGPYFPLMRFGSYWVDYDGGVLMFDSKKEQSDFIKKANDEGKIINGYGKSLKNFNKVEGVDAGFVDEVSGLIDDLDIEQAETLKDGIFQLYLSALPETSMRKRFIHRKKTPGWEQDALRSFSKKAFHDGKQLAKLQYAPAMRKVLADAEEIVKIGNSTRQKGNLERRIRVATEILDALDNGIEYDDLKDQYTQDDDLKLIRRFSRFTDEMDREKAIGDYLNGQRELLKAVEDYMKQDDPQELAADVIKALHKSYANMMESNTSPLTNLINQTVFTYFLGFNPASALINYFQTPGVALPVVAGRHGFAKASKELARAAKIFFTNTHSDDNSFSIQGGLTDAGEIMMYDALTSNGTFDRTRSHDLAGLSEEGIARGTLHRDLMQMSTFMFHKAEVANREITALMAYRLEYAKSGNRMQAIEYAADVVREAHLDYSSANRPDLFQGNAARIFLQFKMYSQGMTYLWGKTAWDSFKSKDPEKKRQARNTILSLIGVQTSMAGIMGLPIGGILLAAQALVSLMDDDDEPVDIEVEIRKALNSVLGDDLGRIAAKGALSETGADFSGRLSMSDLWIREPDKELEGKDASYYLLKTIAGPVAGIVEDIAVGMKLIGEGNTQRGMEKMLPHSVSGLAKAYRMIDEEGATSLTGNVIYETSAWEQAIQAMGMRPSGLAERQMQNSAIKNREMAITDTKSRLIAKAAQSHMKGDSEGYREAMQDIKRFNAKYPHLRITPASIVRSIKTRRANQRNAKDGLVVRKKLGFVREEESFI
jgi:hypothetical protein